MALPIELEWTTEGCRVVIARHGKNCWRLQPICRKRGRWVFVSPRLLHFCCIAHFSYCKRKDATRNIVADGARCINEYPVCCGNRKQCERELEDKALYLVETACGEAEDKCIIKCFGVHAENYGKFTALDNYEYCCYHRCDDRWRCTRQNCSFERAPRPMIIYEEVRE